ATGLGRAAGAAFGLSAIGYRGATLAVPGDALFRATLTLAWVTTSQTAIPGLWLAGREPATLGAVLRGWRATLPVGVTGVIGSGLWFLAFAVMNVAHVRALGQVELIFSALASVLWFREGLGGRDLAGMALLALGVLGLVTRG
ncbi:MAG: EamA family transporter, partial [Rhodobacterales bacterium]|nr:EamA family transporter [Rhodobacterales bacterium]